jgi:hypothetical protein
MACITVLATGGCQSFSEASTPDVGAGDAGGDTGSGSDGGSGADTGSGSDGGGSSDGGGPCGAGVALGAVGTFFGKVNVHTPAAPLDDATNRLRGINNWYPDPDCATGADAEKVGYCQRFWPATSDAVAGSVPPENKPFLPSGCSSFAPSVGQALYFCCQR